jgi:hypothetical protein
LRADSGDDEAAFRDGLNIAPVLGTLLVLPKFGCLTGLL